MSTWAQLLADIRVDLKDTGTTQRWTDGNLFLWTKDAVRDYSQFFPYRKDRVALVLDSGKYPLPDDFVEVVDVECPEDTFLEKRLTRPGARYFDQVFPKTYRIEAGSLYLDGPASGDVYLTYDATHSVPASATDMAFAFTIPVVDEEMIRLYVKAKAFEQVRSQTSSLDRFKLGSGDRQDNPLEPEVGNLMKEYRDKIAERRQGGAIRLWRVGRPR